MPERWQEVKNWLDILKVSLIGTERSLQDQLINAIREPEGPKWAEITILKIFVSSSAKHLKADGLIRGVLM